MKLFGDDPHRHKVTAKNATEEWGKVTGALTKNIENMDKHPGLQAVSLLDARIALQQVRKHLNPILTDLKQRHTDATKAINLAHSKAAENVKKYTDSEHGSEIRATVRAMKQSDIDKLFRMPAEMKPTEIWASLAQSPAVALFITSEQQKVAQANSLSTASPVLQLAQENEKLSSDEISSLDKQVKTTNELIESQINKLRQVHPGAFQGLNA